MFSAPWMATEGLPATAPQSIVAVLPNSLQHQFPLRLGADICVKMSVPPIGSQDKV